MHKVAVIGSGFAGLSAATNLASKGVDVHLFEKNEAIGGRARQFSAKGFTFDMGPSWYWMPEVFEQFFQEYGHEVANHYDLIQLDPSFRMFFGKDDVLDIPANFEELCDLFESIEPNSGTKLRKFMDEAAYKYEVSMEDLIYNPGLSLMEFANSKVIKGAFKLQLLSSFSKYVRKHFKHPKLIALMEFPVLFLGSMPKNTPALYSLMNYAGLKLGTWYPKGGFVKIIEGMANVAKEKGVTIHTNSAINKLQTNNKTITRVSASNKEMEVDAVVGSADYHHVEHALLEKGLQSYSEKYWDKRSMSPSSLIFYVGINKRVKNIQHHNLFFHEDIEKHAHEIHEEPQWPSKPLFYVCAPSITDDTVAPEGCENMFFLVPIAAGLNDTEAIRKQYFDHIIGEFERITKQSIKEAIVYQKSYCVNDFKQDYNSYKGNAYGLANTLMQTANLKPKIRSKKVNNLFYAGQLTVPGPGVPPSIISGKISSVELLNHLKL